MRSAEPSASPEPWRLVCLAATLLATFSCDRSEPPPAPSAAPPPSGRAAPPSLGTLEAKLVSEVVVEATGDTFVRRLAPNQNAGGETRLALQPIVGNRSLFFFDAAAIERRVGTGTLVSARIELTLASVSGLWTKKGRDIAIHRLRQASDEYQATWSCALDSNISNLGADCSGADDWNMAATDAAQQPWVSPPTAVATIRDGQSGVVGFDITADVAAILNGSAEGHGWLVKKVDELSPGALEFSSREEGAAPRLVLQVDGAPPGVPLGPVTGSATLLAARDTGVRQLQPNQNYGDESNLAIPGLRRNRVVVGFDGQALGAALDGALVNARLRLPIAEISSGWGAGRAIGAHRMRSSWTELGATWNCAIDSNPNNLTPNCSGATAWTMLGPAEELAWLTPPTDTVLVGSGQSGTLELDVTRDVACAIAGHIPFDGWLVKKGVESETGSIELHTRESPQPPSLFIEWTDGLGVVVTPSDCGLEAPGCTPTAPQDSTCDGVDDDCDAVDDDDFIPAATSCGVGACASVGETSCVIGEVLDGCQPGAAASEDVTCDGADDDCDGVADEDYLAQPTSCGTGACAATGQSRCVAGSEVTGCEPGTPAAADSTCDGVDDDCDAVVDEEYIPIDTNCGLGACAAMGSTSCANGAVVDSCSPAAPAPQDATCNGTDEDCNGSADEDFVSSCVGSAARRCIGGVVQNISCSDGNPCNGSETCGGAGACAPGSPPNLDDQNPCTTDACTPSGGVTHTPAPGASCFIDLCTAGVCDALGGCQPSEAPPEGDGDPCTVEVCDPDTGLTQTTCAPIDPTVTTTVKGSMAWLYSGPDAIQTGVDPAVIEVARAAVLRGEVRDRDGFPLSGVRVRVAHHPEWGETLTQVDGTFDMVVNGGGLLSVDFWRDGYLNAQRQVDVAWNDFTLVPDVALVAADPIVNEIDLDDLTQSFQVARGSVSTDAHGSRQGTLLVPAGTQALMHHANGAVEEITQLSIRVTEFTLGPNGVAAMPAPLPPTSAYTYAVEFNADEAVLAGATSIEFDRPLIGYIDNFLNFPAGETVPVGAYDRELRNAWVPHESGIVLRVVTEGAAGAAIDVTGDGVADTGLALDALGITPEELLRLAELWEPGDSLWRIEVPHFTWPFDCNWPVIPPPDAEGPPPQPDDPSGPEPDDDEDDDDPDDSGPEVDDPCEEGGSIIECQNLTLRERVALAGTQHTLNYASDRVPGRRDNFDFWVRLSGATVPASLKRIELTVQVLGRRFFQTFPALPGQFHRFEWDGLDAFGRSPQGPVTAKVTTTFVYDAIYGRAQVFGDFGDGTEITGDPARNELFFHNTWSTRLGAFDARAQRMGGWSLSPHHVYDAARQVLYRGDGTTIRSPARDAILVSVGRTFANSDAWLGDVVPDGSVYFTEGGRVLRARDGATQVIAGSSLTGNTGDGGPATAARFNGPRGVAIHRDGLIVADTNNNRLRRIDAAGIVTAFAGTGVLGSTGDGGPALQAQMRPNAMMVGPDGSVYIADTNGHRIRRIDPSGIIDTVAGNGEANQFPIQEGARATDVSLSRPEGIALGPDGTLYIADLTKSALFAVDPEGRIRTLLRGFLGAPLEPGGFEEGVAAAQAKLFNFQSVDVAGDGTVYFTASFDSDLSSGALQGLFALTRSGVVLGVAGLTSTTGITVPNFRIGARAKSVNLSLSAQVRVGPNAIVGSARVGSGSGSVFEVRSPYASLSPATLRVPSQDSDEIYVFEGARHTRTLHSSTGAVLRQFTYDAAGLLTSIVDVNGRTTRIERNTAGDATAIVAPYGHRTVLGMDAAGYLARIENPLGEALTLESTDDGLLTSLIDARDNETTMTYDALGRLSGESHADGGEVTLTPSGSSRFWNVEHESAEGRVTRYEVDNAGGVDSRRVTLPEGNTIGSDLDRPAALADGARADGTTFREQTIAHARFGMAKPLRALTTVLPSGLTRTEALTHTVTGLSATDPFVYTSEVTTRTVNGRGWRQTYTRASNTLTELSPANRSLVTLFDSVGRPLRRQFTGLLPIEYAYDADGRLEAITQGTRRQTFEYFAGNGGSSGYLERRTNPLLQAFEFSADAAGRALSQVTPDGSSTQFGWDANGNLTSVTPPGKPAHGQGYNAVNLLSSYSPPAPPDATMLAEYDLDRLPTLTAHADGATLERVYDTDGKLDLIQTPNGVVDFTYYGSNPCSGCAPGALASVSAPSGVNMSFTHDGQLATGVAWSGAVSGSISWAYDTDFRAIRETVTAGAVSQNAFFGYDADQLLTCASRTSCSPVSADALVIQNDPGVPRPIGSTLGIVSDDYDYNSYGEVAAYTASASGNVVFSEVSDTASQPRDALGRIVFETEFNGGATVAYEYRYDLQGRLDQVLTDGVTTHSASYDANGNRLSLEVGGVVFAATYDAQDRLLTYGPWSYSHTEHGDLSSKTNGDTGEVWRYEYDVRGNLTRVERPDGDVIEYLIDGWNHRVGKLLNGVLVQRWLWRDSLSIAAELDGAGNLVSRFVYGNHPTTPAFAIIGGTTYRVIADHLGSVRALVNATTASDIPVRLDYDVFGAASGTGEGIIPQGFAGGMSDPDTGLIRFGARDYDPMLGRWTTKDPSRFKGGVNLYAYAFNDPVNLIDSSGQFPSTAEQMLRWHLQRNFSNRCPEERPPLDACTEDGRSWEQDMHRDPKFQSPKFRGSDGSECVYGEDGRLEREASFNYCPNPWTLCHILIDVVPALLLGEDYIPRP